MFLYKKVSMTEQQINECAETLGITADTYEELLEKICKSAMASLEESRNSSGASFFLGEKQYLKNFLGEKVRQDETIKKLSDSDFAKSLGIPFIGQEQKPEQTKSNEEKKHVS